VDEKEENMTPEKLKQVRIAAVKRVMRKPLPADMRRYWSSVLRRLDPWRQEIEWMKKK
jgi:hypothetical protein